MDLQFNEEDPKLRVAFAPGSKCVFTAVGVARLDKEVFACACTSAVALMRDANSSPPKSFVLIIFKRFSDEFGYSKAIASDGGKGQECESTVKILTVTSNSKIKFCLLEC